MRGHIFLPTKAPAPVNATLPRPRLVFRTGVTGHRPERLRKQGADTQLLRFRVDDVLRTIRDAVIELHDGGEAPYSTEPPRLGLVTSLAEGSDRIAARSARALDYELQIILPYREEEYARDFDGPAAEPASASEFRDFVTAATAVMDLDATAESPGRYAAAGLALVRQSDVLIAIWDGEPAEGPGGSADNVAEAIRLGIPVVWIDALGNATHEMGLARAHAGSVSRDSWSPAAVRERVREVLLLVDQREPREHDAVRDREGGQQADLDAFLGPDEPMAPLVPVFELASRLFAIGSRDDREVERPDEAGSRTHSPDAPPAIGAPPDDPFVRDVWRCLPPDEWTSSARELVERLGRLFGASFLRADRRAVLHGTVYRNDMTWAYFAAALGGILAAIGVLLGGHEGTEGINWAFVVAMGETGVLAWIWYLYDGMTSGRLHERWLDYRFIAEKLRHIIILASLGSPSLEVRLPTTLDVMDERSHWTNWYLRALLREAGVLPVRLSDGRVRRAARALLHYWLVADQARYHHRSARRAGTIHRRIHLWRNVAFGATVTLALVHAVLALLPHELRPPLGIERVLSALSVVLPVLAAALHAFSNQLDLDGTARRSSAELARLREAWRELAGGADRSSADLMRITRLVSESMLGELVEWRLDLVAKPPLLP